MHKWGLEQKVFFGSLGIEDHQLGVTFTAGLDKAGAVVLSFERFAIDEQSAFVLEYFYVMGTRFADFILIGKAADGTTFHCDNVIFTSLQTETDFELDKSTIAPVAHYSKGVLVIVGEPSDRPVLRWRVKGFESFYPLSAGSPLGPVEMVGGRDIKGKDEISGWLQVSAEAPPPDIEEWRTRANALCVHVLHVMSFAASTKLGHPITEFFHDGLNRVEAYSQTGQQDPTWPVFHFLNLGEIFRCAVKSYFEPVFVVRNLDFAIQWFNMRGAYREANLISAMTVLENLIDSNLTEVDTLILPEKKFEKLRTAISKVIKAQATEWTKEPEEQAAYVRELNSRLTNLKRRSLIDKVTLLAKRWGVTLDDIPQASIQEAKTARDHVVHRGHYQPKPGSTRDLHDHVLTVRELVVRFVLTSLQFEGSYLSYLGGYHSKKFTRNVPELDYVASGPIAR